MDIYYASSYKKAISILQKKPKNGYTSCDKDVRSRLERGFDSLWESPFVLKVVYGSKFVKVRCKNSKLKLSASNGYRILVLCKEEGLKVYVLTVFPKNGPFGRIDIPEKEREGLLRSLIKELNEIKEEK